MIARNNFEERINRLDNTLFSPIKAQTTEADQRSLLAIQACTRDCLGQYVYLEIGSYLGGSIQTHLLDSKCSKIYSIDKRQFVSADERVEAPEYAGNTAAHMLSLLTALNPDQVAKVECFDGDSGSVASADIKDAPNLCFIDGEHTPLAVIRDFEFCAKVCAPDATIVFHDAQTVFRGLRSVVASLNSAGKKFSTHAFFDMLYIICLDGSPIPARLANFSSQAREDDLWSLRNDLRLLKWRATAFGERASSLAKRMTGGA